MPPKRTQAANHRELEGNVTLIVLCSTLPSLLFVTLETCSRLDGSLILPGMPSCLLFALRIGYAHNPLPPLLNFYTQTPIQLAIRTLFKSVSCLCLRSSAVCTCFTAPQARNQVLPYSPDDSWVASNTNH